MNVHDPPRPIGEDHVEREWRVAHPHGDFLGSDEIEQHAVIAGHLFTEHQALATFVRLIRDFHLKCQRLTARPLDHKRNPVPAIVRQRTQDREQQCHEKGKDGRPHPIDTESFDEAVNMLQNSVRQSKLGEKDKSDALKRLHDVAVDGERKGVPLDFLKELIDSEWNHSEKNGGKTFMGDVISGVTRALVDTQNKVLYGKDDEQK